METQTLRINSKFRTSIYIIAIFVTATLFLSSNDAISQVINVPAGDANALIQAIDDANLATDPATINLGGGIYTLTTINNSNSGENGLPEIVTDMTINGNGSTVQRSENPGTPEFRIFIVNDGDEEDPNVTFNNLIIRNGVSTSTGGGGILHSATGIVNIIDSIISDNTGEREQAAGVNNDTQGTMNINRSIITRNIGTGTGAGVGGVINDSSGVLNITDSTVSFNEGPRGGGVGNNSGGIVNILNSTIYGNRHSDDQVESGGGVYNNSGGDIFINFSTITDNGGEVAGNLGNNSGGNIFVANSIIGQSIESQSCINGPGNIISEGYNIDQEGDCGFNSVGDKSGIDPRLDRAGLQDNGGPTPTVALIPGSPALDMADPSCPPPFTDQRGFPRPGLGGDRCDIGAFEGVATISVPSLSQWGLIAMASVLAIFGLIAIRRKRVTV